MQQVDIEDCLYPRPTNLKPEDLWRTNSKEVEVANFFTLKRPMSTKLSNNEERKKIEHYK